MEVRMKKTSTLLGGALLLVLVVCLCNAEPFAVDQVMSWQPENLYLAAILFLCGYALKSATVVFPLMILQIAVGHIYPGGTAVLINLLGLAVVMIVPHLIGKKLGAEKIERILKRYPKFSGLMKKQQENEMALSFMLRACAIPPADIVTMYLGASGMPLTTNVIGGVLGCFPSMMLTTFLGANIRDPHSPAFWKALILNVVWIALSAFGFWLYKKNFPEEETGEKI